MAAKLSGSSGKKYDIDQNSEINVTPFVDVMLVLLIIFMVAAPLATQSLHLDIPPPVKSPPNLKEPPKPALVQIVSGGGGGDGIYVSVFDVAHPTQGVKVEEDQMPGAIAALFKAGGNGPDDQKIFIKASPDTEYGEFVHVMNTLEKSGYEKVGLVTEDFKENQQ
jgi:biopolymer transport protein ExbD